MVSFYLRQRWKDRRLQFNASEAGVRSMKLGDDIWPRIWIPDTFFRNEKRANFHDVTVANRMLRLDTTGILFYVTKFDSCSNTTSRCIY